MYRSTEVRWFFAGELPDAVRTWFDRGDLVRREPERTDEYIQLPDCRTASLKIREGRLEVKARTHAPEAVTYADNVEALRDGWIKWSSNIIDEQPLRQLVERADEGRILVTKQRLLRTFALGGEDPEVVDGSEVWLDNGCQVELTRISVRAAAVEPEAGISDGGSAPSTWWSLSFEAFGEPDRIAANLDRTAAWIFAKPPPVKLPRQASRSYPAWLSSVTDGPGAA